VSNKKPLPKPVAWKNTYFWIAGILLLLGVLGIVAGDNAIRDPGQERESHLYWIYFVGAVVMWVNGVISHSQTVQAYDALQENGGEE